MTYGRPRWAYGTPRDFSKRGSQDKGPGARLSLRPACLRRIATENQQESAILTDAGTVRNKLPGEANVSSSSEYAKELLVIQGVGRSFATRLWGMRNVVIRKLFGALV